jgi:hypothetical protein
MEMTKENLRSSLQQIWRNLMNLEKDRISTAQIILLGLFSLIGDM